MSDKERKPRWFSVECRLDLLGEDMPTVQTARAADDYDENGLIARTKTMQPDRI